MARRKPKDEVPEGPRLDPASLIPRLPIIAAGFAGAIGAALFVGLRVGVEKWKDPAWAGKGWIDAQLALFHKGLDPAFALALMLAALVILVGEITRFRFALYYMAGGGLAVTAAAYAMGLEKAGVSADRMILWQVYATAGILGGAVYWLIAARHR